MVGKEAAFAPLQLPIGAPVARLGSSERGRGLPASHLLQARGSPHEIHKICARLRLLHDLQDDVFRCVSIP